MVIKTCLVCGKTFNTKTTAKCCSAECRKQHKNQYNKERYKNNHEPVIRTCPICGKTFNARGSAICCSPECSKQREKQRGKEYYAENREAKLQYQKEYHAENRKARLEYNKQYRRENQDPTLIHRYKKNIEVVDELITQYGYDLDLIIPNLPSTWLIREAKMKVWFNESYYEGLIAKIESTPVCEVTGKTGELVIHHLYSFKTHPELGNDPANMVRIDKAIHKEFHKIYGRRNNTPEQWCEFLEKHYNGGNN